MSANNLRMFGTRDFSTFSPFFNAVTNLPQTTHIDAVQIVRFQ